MPRASSINPFTLLFYVPTICFINRPLGTILRLIMNEYEMKLRAVFQWCMVCEWSVSDLNMLFSRISNIWHYRRAWLDAKTPEMTSLAAWSRDEANKDLSEFCHA